MERILLALGFIILGGCASGTDVAVSPPSPSPSPSPSPAPEVPQELPVSQEPADVQFRAEADQARGRGMPILIQSRSYDRQNFNVSFYNVSGREIKEIAFQLQPYDAAGKIAGGAKTVEFSGPIPPAVSPRNGMEGNEADLWETAGIDCVEITAVRVTFMDEQELHYPFDSVSRMYRDDVDKWCRFAS